MVASFRSRRPRISLRRNDANIQGRDRRERETFAEDRFRFGQTAAAVRGHRFGFRAGCEPPNVGQPNFVAEQFTGNPGRYVSIEDTVAAFGKLVAGELDDLPEQAFLYCGGLDDVYEKAKKLQAV